MSASGANVSKGPFPADGREEAERAHQSGQVDASRDVEDADLVDPDLQPGAGADAQGQVCAPPIQARVKAPGQKRSLFEKIEAFISRLSTRNNFWHRVCSLIWLPYAFRSGIVMRRIDDKRFSATLPFTRFNKNWYNAMAGAALLGNSEIAGGMYVFSACGGDYTVVCKHLEYKFLRPCFGPAEYRINPREDLTPFLAGGGEFNITIDMDVVQTLPARRKGDRNDRKGQMLPRFGEKRVGRCSATFHVTPKTHHKSKGR
ncbi:MAG: hypothetical protein DYG94_05295 [Leptolyngbya sp. PLA3]|nr:MAG: hypothetical protein EDM82_04830 [Cyanobacteria bacterium CYA]MCE7968149.1 hypothetical protein [Leptolyngbya sp. PL-A3]